MKKKYTETSYDVSAEVKDEHLGGDAGMMKELCGRLSHGSLFLFVAYSQNRLLAYVQNNIYLVKKFIYFEISIAY